jgi:1-aminocyclopropane-1-carboxylate deaminase
MIEQQLNIPSPCHQIEADWLKKADVKLWLKRDDLIHPIISGNKWRKLSGILANYKTEEYKSITTYGGAYSNHLVATACATAIWGIQSKAIIRGEEIKELSPVLQLCKLYGMQLEFVSREEYKNAKRETGIVDEVLFVPEGGACSEGTIGCKTILAEENLEQFSKVFVSCGTGTTLAGMANYLKQKNSNVSLIGIQVLKGKDYIKNDLANNFSITNATVFDEFHCGGYAKTNAELVNFIKDFAKQTGVLLDPIYTGKMMLAIKKLIESDEITSGEKILAIHTGGLTGWFGKYRELNL